LKTKSTYKYKKKSTKANGKKFKITAKMTFSEIILRDPEAGAKLFMMGMGCVGCHMAPFETLEEGAKLHGLDIKKVLSELNS
jgi:hybrid cluster-associated redox disulfide protein